VADTGNHTIRKMTFAGEVTTLAGLAGYPGSANGSGTVARFGGPSGVAIDAAGNVYVAEDNSTIRKITSAGMVTTLAGLAGNEGSVDGTGSAARFAEPQGVALDSATNIYVADTFNNTVRRVTPSGSVTTRAGSPEFGGSADGIGSSARFNHPTGVAVDSATNVYVADTWNHTIRKMTPARLVTTIAGVAGSSGSVDGIGKAARFDRPSGMTVDSAGNLYVADTYNNSIRKLTPVGTNWVVTTLGGMSGFYGTADGAGSAARFSNPNGVAVDSAGNLYVADFYFNTIRKGYPPPKLLNLSFVPGQFRFDLTAPPGHSVVVEASPDLASWLPIWTNTSPLNFSDPQTGVYSHRFYRSVAIAP
jgi:sugar lactone lactonase YvrE